MISFFDKISPGGEERSWLDGTNICFVRPFEGLEGDPRRGRGDLIGKDGDVGDVSVLEFPLCGMGSGY